MRVYETGLAFQRVFRWSLFEPSIAQQFPIRVHVSVQYILWPQSKSILLPTRANGYVDR